MKEMTVSDPRVCPVCEDELLSLAEEKRMRRRLVNMKGLVGPFITLPITHGSVPASAVFHISGALVRVTIMVKEIER